MRIGLIIDVERAVHEQPMLDRVIDDLVGAGDDISLLVPDRLPEHLRPGSTSLDPDTILTYTTARSPWVRRPSMSRLAASLQRETPDLFYVVGRDAWTAAYDLHRRLERPLAISIWSADLVRALPRSRSGSVAAFIVPNEALGRTLEERDVAPHLVSVVPYGVDIPTTPAPIFADPEKTIAIAVLGPTTDTLAYRVVLEAVATILPEVPNVHIAMELRGNKSHEIWRIAQQLDILNHISTVGDAAAVRRLIVGCDALVLPEVDRTATSLLLDAMAAGLAIVALDDPHRETLEHEVNAMIVAAPEVDAWESSIRRLLTHPDLAKQLGSSARKYAEENHSRASQVERLRATFDRVLTGDAIAFKSAR